MIYNICAPIAISFVETSNAIENVLNVSALSCINENVLSTIHRLVDEAFPVIRDKMKERGTWIVSFFVF